jgi:hypothetical protein
MWLSVVTRFLLHSLTGTIVFGTVACPAVLLQLFISRIADACDPPVIILLRIGEYALLVVDLALFLVFLAATTRTTAKSLWMDKESSVREDRQSSQTNVAEADK